MDNALINNFFDNQCSPEEAEEVAEFLLAHPEQLDLFLPVEEWIIQEQVPVLSYDDKLAIKEKIDTVISKHDKVFFLKHFRHVAVAAAACLIIALFIAYLQPWRKQVSFRNITAGRVHYIENWSNKPIDTVLPDGVSIRLQPDSKLSFGENFSSNKTVRVETGKVLFEEHSQTKPIIVVARGIAVTPLGTQFVVNNINDKRVVEVQLIKGSVKVESIDSSMSMTPVILKPNEQLRIDLRASKYILTPINAGATSLQKKESRAGGKTVDALWSNQEIRFTQAALPMVLDKIAIQYKVYIAYDRKELSVHRFTGDIYYTDAIETLMEHICQVSNLDYHIKGDTVLLEKQSAKN
jgi:ferric-dicitrate binding protein FerR (iron transport regulator)